MHYFLARQPVFNTKLKLFGYELSFRDGFNYMSHQEPTGDQAASRVIAESFLLVGPEIISGGKRIFIRFTEKLLVNQIATLFPKDLLAIELNSDIRLSTKLIATCEKMKQAGYLIVLDNYVLQSDLAPLMNYVDLVKVDFIVTGEDVKKSIVEKMHHRGGKCLMKNVMTSAAYDLSLNMGYDYFQGNFFRKPFVLAGRDLPTYKMNYLRILKELHQKEMDYDSIERIIKQDVSLSYKLLRLINSAAFGFLTEIKSIKQALILLGSKEIKKWIALVTLSAVGQDKPEELVRNSLIRAKFCESLASYVNLKDSASELFLAGLFSMIDALVDQPLDASLEYLPLSREIKETLKGNDTALKLPYDLMLSYEKSEWPQVTQKAEKMGVDESVFPEIYVESLKWVNQVFNI